MSTWGEGPQFSIKPKYHKILLAGRTTIYLHYISTTPHFSMEKPAIWRGFQTSQFEKLELYNIYIYIIIIYTYHLYLSYIISTIKPPFSIVFITFSFPTTSPGHMILRSSTASATRGTHTACAFGTRDVNYPKSGR